MIESTIPYWRPKRKCNFLRILQFVFCVACFVFSLIIFLGAYNHNYTLTIITGILTVISFCFTMFCLLDIIAGCTTWPVFWNYWVMVCTGGALLFFLGGGLALVKSSQFQIVFAVLFVITGVLFLIELLYWVGWTRKVAYEYIGPDLGSKSKKNIRAGKSCVPGCKGPVPIQGGASSYGGTFHVSKDVAPMSGPGIICNCCGKPIGSCTCDKPVISICNCCGKPIGVCTCDAPVVSNVCNCCGKPVGACTCDAPVSVCNCCGKPLGSCTCDAPVSICNCCGKPLGSCTCDGGGMMTCACVEEEKKRLAAEEEKRRRKEEEKRRKEAEKKGNSSSYNSNIPPGCFQCMERRGMSPERAQTANYSCDMPPGCLECSRTMQTQTKMVPKSGSPSCSSKMECSPRPEYIKTDPCLPCSGRMGTPVQSSQPSGICSPCGGKMKGGKSSVVQQGFDGPCGCCGAMYPHVAAIEKSNITCACCGAVGFVDSRTMQCSCCGATNMGGNVMGGGNDLRAKMNQSNVGIEQMICSGEDGRRSGGEIFCGSPTCMCAAKSMPTEPIVYQEGEDVCPGMPGRPCMRPAFYFEDIDTQTTQGVETTTTTDYRRM